MLPDVIVHSVNNVAIGQRADDGYINATAMSQAAGKLLGHYLSNQGTAEFLQALTRSIGIPIDLLVNKVTSGPNEQRGTWVHPQVAIHCAMWYSADFAVQVTTWVERWLTTRQHPLRGPDLTQYRGFLELVREARALLQELEMYDDQDRLLLADHVRNVLLAARGQMALPSAGPVALPEPPRVWTISERVMELGYPSRFIKGEDQRVHRYLIQIGKRTARKYRERYPGSDLKTSQRYVDGAQRPVATYRACDLDLMDAAIVEVLGPLASAEPGGLR